MNLKLPKTDESKALLFPHFPAAYQCVIFRNWGLVPPERIAKVLHTDKESVCQSAKALGLPYESKLCPQWEKKGYITIIHYNWHLLSYEDICTLLNWPLERLAFTLREDDFLEVKLGNFKPAVPDCRLRPLTAQEQVRTDQIRILVENTLHRLPPVTAQPFAFTPFFKLHANAPLALKNPRYEERFLYSYCALFGDVLSDRELLDSSFPDELLKAYAAQGITGVWIHIVLYTLVPFPFDPSLSKGWENRLQGMRYLTEKLHQYGLKLFLYFNEPRAMPNSFFQSHPELKGMTEGDYSTLCISRPEVQDYIRNRTAMLAEQVPLLGGFFTITASENLTNCYSHVPAQEETSCPRCQGLGHAESFALVNRLIYEGVSGVSETVKVIAWTWGFDPSFAKQVIEKLPKEISVMNVSEQDVHKTIQGTQTYVLDYSISVEGPGPYALKNWSHAHETGHKAYAKLQLNNSWEMAAVPYLPVFEKTYRHMERLTKAGISKPEGLMLSWSLGGYPSFTLQMLSAFYEEGPLPTLQEIYEKMFPDADIEGLTQAFHCFSEAFDEYPFHITCAYSGPQEHAPANLLFRNPTGFQATMTGFPYDDLQSWSGIFPTETYIGQLKKLSDQWQQGLKLLHQACSGSDKAVLKEILDCAEVCDCHFRSMYLQCLFLCLRDGIPVKDSLTIPDILKEEQSISFRVAAVQAHNPTIGYESANHYFYYRNVLLEKIISCDYLLKLF